MGRPLNSRNFGPGADKIVITFHDGVSVVDGYIVKQTGTRRYQVTADGINIKEVTLAETVDAAENLVDGAATIKALDGEGNVSYVTTLQSVTAITTSGAAVTWSADPDSDSGLVVPVTPKVGERLNVAVNPAATSGGYMFMGTGNLVSNYQISYNANEGIELGLKVHKRNKAIDYKSTEVDGGLVIDTPKNVGTDVLDWVLAFSILTGLDGVDSKLADYEFKFALNLDPAGADATKEMVYAGNGSWKIGSKEILEQDPGLRSKGADLSKVEQNIMNLGWASLDEFRPASIPANWKQALGTFSLSLIASKAGVEVAKVVLSVKQQGDAPEVVQPEPEPEPDVGGDETPDVGAGE